MGTSGWSVELDDVKLQMPFKEQVFNSYNMSTTDHMVDSPSLEVAINIGSGMQKLCISCKKCFMLLFWGVKLVDYNCSYWLQKKLNLVFFSF